MTAPDLLARTAELVDIASVSHNETALADHVERVLRATTLDVERVGDNVVARTSLGRSQRLLLAGHLDTVPPNGNDVAKLDGDVLWGLGSADMKGGLAVMLELASRATEPAVDLSYVFYVCEEVEQEHNGLVHLLRERPDLVRADAAILGEPTGAVVEAGCQGTARFEVLVNGQRAHTARPWMGRNAIHRLAPVLERTAGYVAREPEIDGCRFKESLQAVSVEGFVAFNVVPDRARVVLNHRFAPDRTVDEAMAGVRQLLGDSITESDGDRLSLLDQSAAAPPSLGHPLLKELVSSTGQAPRAKLGWTDVSFFSQHGVPATNFGPGDPNVAHTAEERVPRDQLDACYAALSNLVGG
ncbi:MAG TPA: succinyl-diaminopimelate desuccinylase [Acidimicrobiales bacterium]|nr:succinyl-diaminopimelate desuccinylase [Acidimicrobiales bacterium]